jgi:hypothetical protein
VELPFERANYTTTTAISNLPNFVAWRLSDAGSQLIPGIPRLLLGTFLSERDEVTVDVNEQNSSGRMFYEKMGFLVTGRSDLDDAGRPYPLLHMRWRRS